MVRLSLAVLLMASAPLAVWAQQGQPVAASGPAHQTNPAVHGTVKDSLGHLLGDVNVWAKGPSDSIGARTGADGRFLLAGLRPNVAYVFVARRIGYAEGRSRPLRFVATDTVEIDFVLDPTIGKLPTVHIRATPPPEYVLTAAEMAKKGYADALTAIVFMRPRMLGDGLKNCALDTSTYSYGSTIGWPKPPKPMTNNNAYDFRLFVNGVWHGEQGAKDLLSQIPVEDIQEMRYVDCMDDVTPQFRNSLMVVLKPGVKF